MLRVFVLFLALVSVAILSGGQPSSAGVLSADFEVNDTGDAADANISDALCDSDSVTSGPQCTLRAAIQEANDTNALTKNIRFNIPGDGPHSILPATPYPGITSNIRILGYTEPGASANTNDTSQGLNSVLKIAVDGQDLGNEPVLELSGNNITVEGLVIRDFNNHGIRINGDNNRLQGNFFGTDISGTQSAGAGYAVRVSGSSNLIGGVMPAERNLIVGSIVGVYIFGANATGNQVKGNLIGTGVTGTFALGDTSSGVSIVLGATGNTVGGTAPAERNVISGNNFGVQIPVGTSGNTVAGNYVGTAPNGTQAVPNGIGVYLLRGDTNTVGGTSGLSGAACTGSCNLISGNTTYGVAINGDEAMDNVVQGNHIGLDAGGGPLANGTAGVGVINGATSVLIGGSEASGNVIAFNDGPGVLVTAPETAGVRVQGNRIHSNAGLGIDLSADLAVEDGVTPNDPGDADAGPNGFQNFPVIAHAYSGSTMVAGSLNSTANTQFDIHFFASAECDPSGYGEGTDPIGSTQLATDDGGNALFEATLPDTAALGSFITAVATAPDGSTSEFSACKQVTEPVTPTPTPSPSTATPTPTATPEPTPLPSGVTPAPTATPTPSPTPGPTGTPSGKLLQGDVQCDNDVDSVDALQQLRDVASLETFQQDGCPEIGVAGGIFGDVDCDGDVDSVDALKVLRHVAALSVTQTEPCANIGDPL